MKEGRIHSALLRDVLDGFRAYPGRIGLSFLAVTVGIIAVTMLLSILSGLRDRARLMVAELGGDVIAVIPARSDSSTREARALTGRDAEVLRSAIAGSRVTTTRRHDVAVSGKDRNVPVIETDKNLVLVRGWRIRQGRFLDRRDLDLAERNVVISRGLSESMGIRAGETIRLRDAAFRVVGVVETGAGAIEGSTLDSNLRIGEDAVFMSRTVAAPWQEGDRAQALRVDAIFLQVPQGADVGAVLGAAQRILSGPGEAQSTLSWITPDVVLQGIRRLQRTMKLAGGSIAFLCLLLGGATLMSLMVANVRDRVTEIGLRRALGATPSDVAGLFVVEACGVTGLAGIVGLCSALILLAFLRARFEAPLVTGWVTVVVPSLLSVLMGAVFSYWPARIASRISPAEALRND